MRRNPAQRILFVSNERLAVSLRRQLNARGFAVTCEQTSTEAFDQLTRSSFDIIVIDLASITDAGEFIEQIKKFATFKTTPIVVVGEWGTGRPLLALSAGADALESAPIDVVRLIDGIARLPRKRAAAAGNGN